MFAIVVSGEIITCYQPILIIRKEWLFLDLTPKAIVDSWGKQFNSIVQSVAMVAVALLFTLRAVVKSRARVRVKTAKA